MEDPRIPAAAKLRFLDFVEEVTRQHGHAVLTALLEHVRSLIRAGAL